MKKIVALGAAAALVGGLFAAEPASNPSVVEFTGNASVEWGVDLDAGKTGFQNDSSASFKMKLFDTGTKETSSDGDIWAELKIKIEDDDSVGPNGVNNGTPKWKAAAVDTAKLHFYKFYVGIQSGDTKVGETDFTTAIKSADPWFHPGRWLDAVGPSNFTQGIVAGYDDDNMNLAVDFRSYKRDKDEDNGITAVGRYSDAYSVAAEFTLKDTNSFAEGLSAGLGAAYNLSDFYFEDSTTNTAVAEHEGYDYTWPIAIKFMGEDLTTGVPYDHLLGYSANVGYKLKIDDKLWLKPQAGFQGSLATYKNSAAKVNYTANENVVVAGVMFGWGETASYGNTGTLYYFDDDWGDKAKGLTPGFSAIVKIPLPSTITIKSSDPDYTISGTYHNALKALIVPSLYSGDIVENLKFAAYSEIGLFDYREENQKSDINTTSATLEGWGQTKDYKNTFALALAAGVKYDIKADDITVTPKASIRYANTCYAANKAAITGAIPNNKDMFSGLGEQKIESEGDRAKVLDDDGNPYLFAGDFFNLEAGVEVAGLINNTTFFGHYKSANLLNKIDYKSKEINNAPNANYAEYGMYNVKLGTFNVGCKISF